MIVALIGLGGGFIQQDVYVSIIIMSLATTIVTPILLRNWLFREGRRARGGERAA